MRADLEKDQKSEQKQIEFSEEELDDPVNHTRELGSDDDEDTAESGVKS